MKWPKSKPAPRIALEPILPGSFNQGPPELVHKAAKLDLSMINPPIVSLGL